MKQLHQDLKQQEVMSLIHGLSRCGIEVVLLHDALEHLNLLELFLELKRESRVALLDYLEHVENELVNLRLKFRVLVE